MTSNPLAAVVLAAGHGKRMRSSMSKVLHHVSGRPMIDHGLDALEGADVPRIIVVTGYDQEAVKAHLATRLNGHIETVNQDRQLGTGHAVMQARPLLTDFEGLVVITYGDAPLWRSDTIRDAITRAEDGTVSGVVLSMRLEDPTGYGRVIRDPKGHVKKIVEQKDATEEEARVAEVNSGTYCFRASLLFEALDAVTNENAQGEYYLTDVIEILIRQGHRILAHEVPDATEALGVNSRIDLARAESALQKRTLQRIMEEGVTVVDPRSTWVDSRVQIGEDTTLFPNTVLRGHTIIGRGCRIGPNTELSDAQISDGVTIRHSVIERHSVGPDTMIGPFATLIGQPNRRSESPTINRLG